MSRSATARPDGSRVSDYEYELPAGRIARYPTERRDESRLLVLNRRTGAIHPGAFQDVAQLVRPGDVLVVNESRVMPARLVGRKPTGAPAEILLIRPVSEPDSDAGAPPSWNRPGAAWEALVRPGGKLKPGRTVVVSEELSVEILDSTPGGGRLVRLVSDLAPLDAIERFGHVPLPPYMGRPDEPLDRTRYQTVYARTPGSVAAPTAGLHFTPELLARVEERDVAVVPVTLHVGPGTFRPVDQDDPAAHRMHTELYHIPEGTVEALSAARAGGGRVWAVGTTVVRTLESAAAGGAVTPGSGATALFIRPPYEFQAVDALITNFHLPRSTLLMLVAAFGGYRPVMDAYRAAVDLGCRFYSYGDAMAIV